MRRNPFSQLYVGDKMPPEEFVALFSTELVHPAMPIFERGNVVLSGVQGTGKSMLFKLLMPEVRLAYAAVGEGLPIPDECRRFIAGGININADRCNQFGRRRPPPGDHQQERMFADFLNAFVCLDLLKTVQLLASDERTRCELDLSLHGRADELGQRIAFDPSFLGYLDGAATLDEVSKRLERRLTAYRRFLAGADQQLDPRVSESRTHPGDPIQALVGALRATAVVPTDVEVFVLVDQYEELATIKTPDGDKPDYRGVVNGIINRRDATLSYRVGTRGYAWRDHLFIFGTDARIEQDRDFKLVDLDAKLKRYEDASTDIFPDFASNVFERRMGRVASSGTPRTLRDVLGRSLSLADKARELAGGNRGAAIKPDPGWSAGLRQALVDIAATSPLDAKLAEVWVRQKGAGADLRGASSSWRKERSQLALLKIAGARRQRVMYWGEDDIIALSGGNILTFLSLCQHVWDNALQTPEGQRGEIRFPIRPAAQTIGVYQASRWWLDRIEAEYGRGADRHKFVLRLGEAFNMALNGDDRMSYPGHSGISLTLAELDANPDIRDFLTEAVDFGNITRREHTTRSSDRKRRIKFYLSPVYCPLFRLPLTAVKEPMYIDADQVRRWMVEAGVKSMAGLAPTEEQRALPRRRHHRADVTTLPLLEPLQTDTEG